MTAALDGAASTAESVVVTPWRWTRRRLVVTTVLVGIAALTGATARLFVWPSTDAVRPVDAVVLFAGGRGERLERAEALMQHGVARDLVVPNGMASEWPAGNLACTEPRPYRVHCPIPSPDTTRGEARAVARLAEEHGWRTVLAVTSTYQVSRAGLLLSRCFDGQTLTVSAAPHIGISTWLTRIVHEWIGWSEAVLIERGC